ncbi:MAG: hypothetical protein GQ531_09225 [Sulfurovum sp.]|nr:hypothetical protein [Sulfurovum sp.]
MESISIQDLENLSEDTYVLIHVLPPEHYKNVHLKGALNICVYEASFVSKVQALNLKEDQKLIFYGQSENELDAKTACEKLKGLIPQECYVLEGGLDVCTQNLEGEQLSLDDGQFLHPQDGKYVLENESKIEWTGANANGKHFGEILLKHGSLTLKDQALSGDFILDMNSIKTLDLSPEEGASYLDEHLRSEDFFLVKLFPEARYSFNDIKALAKPYQTDINYQIKGDLTLRGLKRTQSFNLLLSEVDDKLVMNARVELDKTRWDIFYGSAKFFKFLGMHKIFDTVFIEMRLELRRENTKD